jgi:hypothetical protein
MIYFHLLMLGQAVQTLCRKLGNPAGRTALAKRFIEKTLRNFGMNRQKANRFVSRLWTPFT